MIITFVSLILQVREPKDECSSKENHSIFAHQTLASAKKGSGKVVYFCLKVMAAWKYFHLKTTCMHSTGFIDEIQRQCMGRYTAHSMHCGFRTVRTPSVTLCIVSAGSRRNPPE